MDMNMIWLSIGLKFCMLAAILIAGTSWWVNIIKKHAKDDLGLYIGLLVFLAMIIGAVTLFIYWIQPDLLPRIVQ